MSVRRKVRRIKRDRDKALTVRDIYQLSQFHSEALSLAETSSSKTGLKSECTNIAATCAIYVYDCGAEIDATTCMAALKGQISADPDHSRRVCMLSNLLLLSSHHYGHTGDADPLERAIERIPEVFDKPYPPFFIAAALSAFHELYNANPETNQWALHQAVSMVPDKMLQKITEENATARAKTALIYSAIAQDTGSEAYIDDAISLREGVIECGFLDPLELAHEKVNQAGDLLKRLELTYPGITVARSEADRALRLARQACAEADDLGQTAHARAINLEMLAYCLLTTSELQDHSDISLLREALATATESTTLVPFGGAAWARHASQRVEALTVLHKQDGSTWADEFLAACLEMIRSTSQSPTAHWEYGQWLVESSPDRLAEGLSHMLQGADQYPSPTTRIDKLNLTMRMIQGAGPRLTSDAADELYLYLVHSLLANFRGALWSSLGTDYNRAIAKNFSWIGSAWADVVLRKSGDWASALTALSVVSGAIWAMDSTIASIPEPTTGNPAPDSLIRYLQAISNADTEGPERYDSEEACPTLVVLIPGSDCGWAIVRGTRNSGTVVRLPEFSVDQVETAGSLFGRSRRGASTRRGGAGFPSNRVETWLRKTVADPLLLAGLDFGDWTIWCPIGSAIGLPLHIIVLGASGLTSYSTDPMFVPRHLTEHRPSGDLPSLCFAGWSEYPQPGWNNLPGVLHEADVYRRLVPSGTVWINTTTDKLDAKGADILHLACHGGGASSNGQAFLLLGPERLDIPSLVRGFREDRALVLVNACLTAEPDDALADQHQTIVKAFQASGARSVLGSLWEVSDAPHLTELLVDVLYCELLGDDACLCEKCVAASVAKFSETLRARRVGWEDTANWVHFVGRSGT